MTQKQKPNTENGAAKSNPLSKELAKIKEELDKKWRDSGILVTEIKVTGAEQSTTAKSEPVQREVIFYPKAPRPHRRSVETNDSEDEKAKKSASKKQEAGSSSMLLSTRVPKASLPPEYVREDYLVSEMIKDNTPLTVANWLDLTLFPDQQRLRTDPDWLQNNVPWELLTDEPNAEDEING